MIGPMRINKRFEFSFASASSFKRKFLFFDGGQANRLKIGKRDRRNNFLIFKGFYFSIWIEQLD